MYSGNTLMTKIKRCQYCQNASNTHKIINIFKNFDTSDNREQNMIAACENCARAFKLRYMSNAVLTLKVMGLRPDFKGVWRLDKELVRNELSNERELRVRIAYLEKEVHDLEHYIKLLERKGYEPYDPIEGLR